MKDYNLTKSAKSFALHLKQGLLFFFTGNVRRTFLMIIMFSLIVPICAIGFVTVYNTSTDMIQAYEQNSLKSIHQIAQSMEYYFKSIDEISLSIYRDVTLFESIQSSTVNRYSDYYQRKYNESCILNFFRMNKDHYSVRYRSYIDSYNLQYERATESRYNFVYDFKKNSRFAESYYSPEQTDDFDNQIAFYLIRAEDTDYLTYCRIIYALPRKKPIGEFSIIQSLDYLQYAGMSYVANQDEVIIIYSSLMQQCLYTNADEQTLASIEPSLVKQEAQQSVSQIIRVDGQQWSTFRCGIPQYGITICKVIPYQAVYADINAAAMSVVFSCGLSALVALALARVLSRSITKPITSLKLALTHIRQGKYDTPVECSNKGNNEIIDAIHEFNHMSAEINSLVKERLISRINIQESELRAQQATINPHFITNTMQSIGLLAVERNAYDIKYMIDAFCDIMRYSISRDNITATVQQELKHVGNYLAIQKLRLHDRISFTVNCEPQAEDITIPRMSIQPLVENVIQHGLSDSGHTVQIDVVAQVQEGQLVLCIHDNGKGFSCDVQQFMQRLQNESYTNTDNRNQLSGIGITNVNNRMKLMFQDLYHLEIASAPNSGTVICIYIRLAQKDQSI